MSTITHIETSKGKFRIEECPKGAAKVEFKNETLLAYLDPKDNAWVPLTQIWEGNWQLVSEKTTRNYSEEEAAQVVDNDNLNTFRCYTEEFYPFRYASSKSSLASLLESHGLSKENEYVILKLQSA